MDPTTAKKHHHLLHPQPDPTIQNISHRFSKLYINHKNKITQPTPTTTTLTVDPTKPHISNPTTQTNLKKEIVVITSQEEEIKKKKKLMVVPIVQQQQQVTVRRRKSFSSSQLSDFFSCAGVKVVAVDMPSFMQIHAVDCARKAHDSLEKFTSKTLALTLKKEFDGVYGPAWHCIVGTSFGSFVTHSVGGFMYFSLDHKLYVLLFKTTVQRAASPELPPP